MRLTVFNGSPRLGVNNTEVLVKAFLEGFRETGEHDAVIHKLNRLKNMEEASTLFEEAEFVLVAFPLYSYAMPAGVKAFIEEVAERSEIACGQNMNRPRKKLGFMVQYGFKEAVHARPLEAYLIQLSEELNCDYAGTIIKGGCDGLARTPDQPMNKKTLAGAKELGALLGKEGVMDQTALNQYALPETQRKSNVWVMKIVMKLINQFYWKAEMKKNGAVPRSFDKPYGV